MKTLDKSPLQSADGQSLYPPELFQRHDEADDSLFYAAPRLVVHIDDAAIAAIGSYFREALPRNGVILDLMSSWRSHLPPDLPVRRLIGLGMNITELDENPQLDSRVIHDINANPALPFDDCSMDAAVVTVSIQYMTEPIAVFREIRRILKADAAFHVIYSNRMFPTKAVAVWQSLDDRRRAQLIASYFQNSGDWSQVRALNITPPSNGYTDPVYVVTASKVAS